MKVEAEIMEIGSHYPNITIEIDRSELAELVRDNELRNVRYVGEKENKKYYQEVLIKVESQVQS